MNKCVVNIPLGEVGVCKSTGKAFGKRLGERAVGDIDPAM